MYFNDKITHTSTHTLTHALNTNNEQCTMTMNGQFNSTITIPDSTMTGTAFSPSILKCTCFPEGDQICSIICIKMPFSLGTFSLWVPVWKQRMKMGRNQQISSTQTVKICSNSSRQAVFEGWAAEELRKKRKNLWSLSWASHFVWLNVLLDILLLFCFFGGF